MMLSRQALHRLRPVISRVGTRALASQAGQQSSKSSKNAKPFAYTGALLGLVAAGASAALMEASALKPHAREPVALEDPNTPPSRPGLPTIPLEEVAEHSDEDSLWYTFRGAVYDLTFFINGHPGGTPVSKIQKEKSFRFEVTSHIVSTRSNLFTSIASFDGCRTRS
jgi:hypothetical protein